MDGRRLAPTVLHTKDSDRRGLNGAGFVASPTARHRSPAPEAGSMPLGGVTDKVQKILDTAEELYQRVMELREQMMEVSETVQETDRKVEALENKVDHQSAILEALAEREGVDVDELVTEVAIEEAEPDEAADGSDATGADENGDAVPEADPGDDEGA